MKSFLPFSLLLLVTTCFYSCKKDGASSSNSLLGTWNIVSDEVKEYQNGTLVSDNVYPGTQADEKSIRFDNNNTAFVVGNDNTASTVDYNYSPQDKVILINDQSFVVQTLTSSSFVIFAVDPSNGGPDRSEITITWKR